MSTISMDGKGFNSFTTKVAATLVGLVSIACASVALGHHAAQVTYQMDQIIEVEGEITRLIWRNPHIRFTLSTTDAQGNAVEWNV